MHRERVARAGFRGGAVVEEALVLVERGNPCHLLVGESPIPDVEALRHARLGPRGD